jgi:UDP-N-acetylmuramoyl-tripeptide--D-alanyl-D-alanine ligase
MRELGDAAEALHHRLGDQVVTLCGADLLLACGDHADEVVAGARAAGMPPAQTMACRDPQEILARHECSLRPGDVMLVKGSRALAMERLVQALRTREVAWAA